MTAEIFASLAFQFNSLLDAGHAGELFVVDVKDSIERRTVFSELQGRYGAALDVSEFDHQQLDAVIDQWQALAVAADEQRRFGVSHDGLCLLVAYCLECMGRVGQ